jgi:hypothetical protein
MGMCCLALLAVGALLVGCDSGPGASEIVSACMQEGARGANKALRREMGIKSEKTFCHCVASEVKSNLTSDGQRVMLLEMQGQRGEARAISSKMNDSDQAALMHGAMKMIEKCALVGR